MSRSLHCNTLRLPIPPMHVPVPQIFSANLKLPWRENFPTLQPLVAWRGGYICVASFLSLRRFVSSDLYGTGEDGSSRMFLDQSGSQRQQFQEHFHHHLSELVKKTQRARLAAEKGVKVMRRSKHVHCQRIIVCRGGGRVKSRSVAKGKKRSKQFSRTWARVLPPGDLDIRHPPLQLSGSY